ncbi:hypothetical protein BT63DRAFT_199048 [Microthyrium microscopicum]|uniref:UbiA prenyltransferase n=1 Tax=Microthyrium microscopicum TaxID=703497 RepID=A0A6A6UM64_9PEZI|nr:hypothetical protein BT63DRAFT_199048 [Microthyrium microscopicum]
MTDSKESIIATHEPEQNAIPSFFAVYLALARRGLYNIWLFNFSDMKTIVVPQTLLAITNAKSGQFLLHLSTEMHHPLPSSPSWLTVLYRVPPTLAWIYLNLLVECVANQRLPGSIQEDSLNKPWRVMPSKLMSPASAEKLLFYLIPTTLIVSYYMGEMQFKASASLMSFIWLYNDLDGANSSPIMRNALNAFGLLSFSIGSTAVAVTTKSGHGGGSFAPTAVTWFSILWLAICTTIHAQDFADIAGDKARGRCSAPLLYGDSISRWSVAVPVMFWTFAAPAYWGLPWHHIGTPGIIAQALVVIVGTCLAVLVVGWNSLQMDTWMWRMWCLWSASLFVLPLFGSD